MPPKGKSTAPPKKRPLSSYMLFFTEQRPILVKENPDLTFGEIGRKLGEIWKEKLSPTEKAKYEQMAADAKAAFDAKEKDEVKKDQTEKRKPHRFATSYGWP